MCLRLEVMFSALDILVQKFYDTEPSLREVQKIYLHTKIGEIERAAKKEKYTLTDFQEQKLREARQILET